MNGTMRQLKQFPPVDLASAVCGRITASYPVGDYAACRAFGPYDLALIFRARLLRFFVIEPVFANPRAALARLDACEALAVRSGAAPWIVVPRERLDAARTLLDRAEWPTPLGGGIATFEGPGMAIEWW